MGQVSEDELLNRYGLRPSERQLDDIRNLLIRQAELRADADTEVLKLCCVQLFHPGSLSDVLLIWQAKESSWDAHCSIDVQLLCGPGLAATKSFLAAHPSSEARSALDYLSGCETAGDFDGFSVADQSAWYEEYYNSDAGSLNA